MAGRKKSDPALWLEWAREIQALSQTGLTFSENEYSVLRYRRLAEIASEIVENHTRLEKQSVVENFLVQPGYATPKVDVRGAAHRDGRVLMVQERVDQRWCLPGGWADVGETPSQMVIRETREESGFEVEVEKVVGIYDANRRGIPEEFYHAYKIVFQCRIVGGEARASDETLAVDFFSFDQLPPLSMDRTSERHLADVRDHLRDPALPTVFD